MKTYIGKPRIENQAFLLDLDLVGLPQEIVLESERFVLKSEFHVTMLGRSNLGPRYFASTSIPQNMQDEKVAHFRAAVEVCIEGLEFRIMIEPAFFRVRQVVDDQGLRQSIIATCFVAHAAEFYNRFEARSCVRDLGFLYSYTVEYVPHHVTLYTTPDEASRRGIGIYSATNFGEIAKKISHLTIPNELKIF